MGSSESEQHSQRWSSMACGLTAKLQARVEACEAEDGRQPLWCYTSEAEEEIRGVGFVNHQSTGNLWQHVVRQPPRMATRVSENGDRTLGFCKSEAKEEICNVGFAKRWRKTNRYEGRLELTVWRGFFFFVNSGGRDNGEKKRERSYVLTLRWFVLCLLIFFWHMSCIRIKIGGNRRNLNWRGSIPLIWAVIWCKHKFFRLQKIKQLKRNIVYK